RPRKFLKHKDVCDILDDVASIGQLEIVRDKIMVQHDINEAVRKSNIARAILLPNQRLHESIKERQKIQRALEIARRTINPTSKQRDHHALHHYMELEFDRLADPDSAKEPVTIGGSQIKAMAECTASFPDFADDDVLCKVLREVPHCLL